MTRAFFLGRIPPLLRDVSVESDKEEEMKIRTNGL